MSVKEMLEAREAANQASVTSNGPAHNDCKNDIVLTLEEWEKRLLTLQYGANYTKNYQACYGW